MSHSMFYMKCWCPQCSYNKKKNTLKECIDHATTKGGKCLSAEYVNNKSDMLWECKKKHTWTARYSNIKQGGWCPRCSNYRSEELTREIFERLTGHMWVKIRPLWLERLELDGYCEELNTAFEYQGTQHVKHVPYFHTEQQFQEQCDRDKRKKLLCAGHGVRLIEIPHIYDFRRPDALEKFISESIIKD
jgi:hypothetical protein